MSDAVLTAIGLMAGTSLDGVDVAVLETDGDRILRLGPTYHAPYDGPLRASVLRATKAALEGRNEAKDITEAADLVTTAHIEAVRDFLDKEGIAAGRVDVIGFHGQTILHRPPMDSSAPGHTWQIGAGATLAHELRIDVIDQFRQADMAHRGQGAPLVPIYHRALVASAPSQGPVAVLNIGGVANVTYVPVDEPASALVAFDCGPGNGLIDEWVSAHSAARMDVDGALARQGQVDEEVVALMALSPYLRRPAPKSLDRYDFKLNAVDRMSLADGAATLTAFTAECVARSTELMPAPPTEWIVCGGGRHNPVLMEELQARIEVPVLKAEDKGWRGDMIEAECFGFLAVRSLKGLANSFPKTTGVVHPVVGGHHHRKPV